MYSRSLIISLLSLFGISAFAQELKLFSPEQREVASHSNAAVMNFLERYFNELPKVKHTTTSTKMADDKVFFRNGKLTDLYHVADTMPFSITLAHRYYEVEWKNRDKPFVTVVFPAQYDLLLGMQQEEAQKKIKEAILSAPQRKSSFETPKGMTRLEDSIYMSKTEYMELESFNDAIYYNKVGKSFKPYFGKAHPDYSAANLFHGLADAGDYRMFVEQSVYGLKSVNYTITLRQWLNYCEEWGLKVFFAIEEQRKDGLLALVVAQSKEFGFNHMLSVVIPDKFVNDKNAVLKVRMTPYIPIHNIKNLFQKESVNHRRIKWQ